jgi:hypothetical protein
METMTKLDVYRQILRSAIRDDMRLEDMLLSALVLHTHSIALRPDVDLDDVRRTTGERRLVLAPLTNTHVTELMASLWPHDEERGREDFWFERYARVTPYELFADVPDELRDRAVAAREAIAKHELIEELIEE